MNIGLAVHRNAIRNPNSEALFGDESLSYEELDKKSNQIAHYLLSLGYEKGDRVAVLLPNRSEIIELTFLKRTKEIFHHHYFSQAV